ncbi:MAG: Hsp70 family protein, partial [Planctomycetaceae bacterium]
TAATLAHAWTRGDLGRGDSESRGRRILLFDLGGGTFDVTIVHYTATHFEVLATDGDTFLGGLDWTARIEDYIAEMFQKQHKFDPRGDAQFRLHLTEQCEAAKHRLSQSRETRIRLECSGKQFTTTLTRTRYEELTADLLQRAADTTQLVLQDGGVDFEDLDDILLVGGSSHMPAVTEMLAQLSHRKPLTPLDPQLAVAQGAAVHAAILEARATRATSRQGQAILNRLNRITTQDVNAHSLGVELTPSNDGIKRNHIMIPRNSQLPVEIKQRFVTTDQNPVGIRIRLLEGEAPEADACVVVGDCRIANLPSELPAGSPVEITYSYDDRRRIHVTARELTGKNEATVQIVWESGKHADALTKFEALANAYAVR